MRNLHDIQSLLYVFAYIVLVVSQWIGGVQWLQYLALLFFVISLQIIHHNHVHLGIWNSKFWNRATSYIISVLTAIPTAMMIGGHIKNHHVHQHGPEDVTRTYRFGGDHNHAVGYLLHPFQAFAVLLPMFWKQFSEQWPKKTRFAVDIFAQSLCVLAVWVLLAFVDWQKCVFLVLVPQAIGLHWLLGANYLQHAHCDNYSDTDYARNFTGAINWVWFNIGFHTVHHDQPKQHWSNLRTIHNEEYQHVDTKLNERSLLIYVVRVLLLGPLIPRLKSQSLKTH